MCFVWGSSEFGQLGTGKNEKELSPIELTFFSKKTIKSIACGYSHSLFLTKSENVYATGYNSHGELGLGNSLASFLPVKLLKLKHENIISIFAGDHSAALTEKGDIYLWGSGVFGEFSYPKKMNAVNEKFIDISIGFGFGVGVDANGFLHFWGENQSGQLGFGDFIPRIALTYNKGFEGKKVKKISCGGQFMVGLFEEDEKILKKNNIIENIMNEITTSKKRNCDDSVSNRKIIVNNTEMKNKRFSKIIYFYKFNFFCRTSKKETLKENQTIKETIKLKSLFGQNENNITGYKSIDSGKQLKAKNSVSNKKCMKKLSNSFDLSNNPYAQKPEDKAKFSFDNSMEIKKFEPKHDNDEEESLVLMKNKQNGLEFKIKIKEYEDCIKLLELKERSTRKKLKQQDCLHHEKYHQLSQIYKELKTQYEALTDEISRKNEVISLKHKFRKFIKNSKKFENEASEKKRIEEKLKLFAREKAEWNKILSQQNNDIDALNESFMVLKVWIKYSF